jgi:hypothetical protein
MVPTQIISPQSNSPVMGIVQVNRLIHLIIYFLFFDSLLDYYYYFVMSIGFFVGRSSVDNARHFSHQRVYVQCIDVGTRFRWKSSSGRHTHFTRLSHLSRRARNLLVFTLSTPCVACNFEACTVVDWQTIVLVDSARRQSAWKDVFASGKGADVDVARRYACAGRVGRTAMWHPLQARNYRGQCAFRLALALNNTLLLCRRWVDRKAAWCMSFFTSMDRKLPSVSSTKRRRLSTIGSCITVLP